MPATAVAALAARIRAGITTRVATAAIRAATRPAALDAAIVAHPSPTRGIYRRACRSPTRAANPLAIFPALPVVISISGGTVSSCDARTIAEDRLHQPATGTKGQQAAQQTEQQYPFHDPSSLLLESERLSTGVIGRIIGKIEKNAGIVRIKKVAVVYPDYLLTRRFPSDC